MSIQVYNGLALYPIAADLDELQTLGILPPELKGEKITPKNRSFADTRNARSVFSRPRLAVTAAIYDPRFIHFGGKTKSALYAASERKCAVAPHTKKMRAHRRESFDSSRK